MAEEDSQSCESLINAIASDTDDSSFMYAVATLRGQMWMSDENPRIFAEKDLVKILCSKIISHAKDTEAVGKMSSILQNLFQFRGALRVACSRCRMEIKPLESYMLCPGEKRLKFHPGCLTCKTCEKPVTSYSLNAQLNTLCATCTPVPPSALTHATAHVVAAPETPAPSAGLSRAEILAAAAKAPQAPFTDAFEGEIDALLDAVAAAAGGDSGDFADEVAAVVRSYAANEPRTRIVACLKYVAQRTGPTASGAIEGVGVVLRAFAYGPTGPFVKAALRSLVQAATTSGPLGQTVKTRYGPLLERISQRADAAPA